MDAADRHLDELELDALRAGEPLPAAAAAHAAWCVQCRAALADLHALAAALRTQPLAPPVPAAREAAILAVAGLHTARARRRQRRAWAATAAAAALAVFAIAALLQTRQSIPAPVVVAGAPASRLTADAADLDGDGRVTVLDAFALARAERQGTPTLGDVDTQVDAVLALAVSVRSP